MDDQTQNPQQNKTILPNSAPLMPEPIADGSLGSSAGTQFTQPTDFANPQITPPEPPAPPPTVINPTPDATPPTDGTYLSDGTVDDSAATFDSPPENDAPDTEPEPYDDNGIVSDDLLNLKQQALEELSPLVGQLEQSPEDKFRTTMMLIQASDNQSLIQAAYDAAKEITDEKVRAQALLDVVNEINYFTHNKKS